MFSFHCVFGSDKKFNEIIGGNPSYLQGNYYIIANIRCIS